MSDSQQPAEQVEANLPAGAKEETKEQFEKLLEHNRQMAQRLEQLEKQNQPQFTSVLDEVSPPSQAFKSLTATQVNDAKQSLIDQDGYVDQDLLDRKLRELAETKDRLMLTEERVEKFELKQLERDVHARHPQLDPYRPEFNPEFYKATKEEVLKQLSKGYQDYEAAAAKVAAEFKARATAHQQNQQVKEEEVKKVISQREQASVKTGARVAPTQTEYDGYEAGLRKGDALSIGQLLKANGH